MLADDRFSAFVDHEQRFVRQFKPEKDFFAVVSGCTRAELWSPPFFYRFAYTLLLVEQLLHVADFTLDLPACFFRRPAIRPIAVQL